MTWAAFNAETLFPDATKSVLEGTGDVADAVATAAETAASVIDTLADLLVDLTDPERAMVEAFIQQLKDLLSDTMNTGLYMFWDATGFPFYKLRSYDHAEMTRAMNIDAEEATKKSAAEARGETYNTPDLPLVATRPTGWTGWVRRWEMSFDDQGDERRPIFSDDAEVSALLFVAGTPSLDALPAMLAALGRLFGIKEFSDLLDRLAFTELTKNAAAGDKEITVNNADGFTADRFVIIGGLEVATLEFATPRNIDRQEKKFTLYDGVKRSWPAGTPVILAGTDPQTSGGNRTAPDWHSRKVSDIPPMREVEKLVKRVIGLLEMAPGILGLLQELAEALSEKADQLRDLAEQVENAIELIEQILALTGVYAVRVDSSEGISGLFEALDDAGRPPLPDASYIVGICLLAATADLGPVAELFGV